jgi:hypothetical protein
VGNRLPSSVYETKGEDMLTFLVNPRKDKSALCWSDAYTRAAVGPKGISIIL